MKKSLILLSALAVIASVFTGCKKDEPTPTGKAVTFANALTAVDNFYKNWENDRTIPAEVKIGTQTFTISEFLYLEATLINNIKESKSSDIDVLTYVAASNPDRDTYDKEEIDVTNGTADAKGEKEDVVTIASRILAAAAAKSPQQMPNQTLIYRTTSDALAFSTNRAIVTIARAISAYVASGKLEGKVSTEYLSGGTSLKAFAQEFVKYLDVWQANVCPLLSSDGSHCEDNNTAWENVHFIPIPQDTKNDWKKQGGQWDEKYQPYKTVTIGTDTYTAANCWEIAIRGLMDMCTAEGNDFLAGMTERNKAYTLANNKSLTAAPIRKPSENCIWGKYPWYEHEADGGTVKYNGQPIKEVDINFIIKCGSWHVVRGLVQNAGNTPLGMIGNFQVFGTNASSSLVLEGYEGEISPMREFLILARIYKYLLDNDINANVYDAIKDAKFDFDLYNQEAVPVVLTTDKLDFDAQPTAGQDAKFTTTGAWTATPSETWIHISPASGAAGEITAAVTLDNNTDATPRSGKITVAVGEYSKDIAINQAGYVAPTTATLAEFATEFVKCLDVWEKTIGTVDADGLHNGTTAWKDVHLLPIDNPNAGFKNAGNQYDATLYSPFWKATIKGTDYTANQCWEIAIRGLMNLCTSEGEAFLPDMTDRNKAYTLANAGKMSDNMPSYSSNNVWGGNPWYEYDQTVTDNGEAIYGVDINFIIKCGSWHVVRSFIKNSGNNPLGNIGNFQTFGTTSSTLILSNYSGNIAPMRELLIMARIYKYILDNKITENVYDAIKDKSFNFGLYETNKPTIKEFATEYVKILDVWQNTTGTINMLTGENPCAAGQEAHNVENAHYVPDATTISVKGIKYTTGDMMEIGQRCYLLLRGWDGNWTAGTGVANYAGHELAGSTMSGTKIPDTHGYTFGQGTENGPYNETSANGGSLTPTQVKFDILDNFAMRSTNWGITRSGVISNMCGYTNSQVAGYGGVFCARRALLTYAKFFKYMLDNSLEDTSTISPTQAFESIMF